MASKKEQLTQEIAKAVGAGKAVVLETVDFSDPDRPKTCLEVDFPILPVNQVAAIEGNAGKPIYQMSKWWARRRSSVFRSMLIAASTKAPEDPAQAAKLVWDHYYADHQKKGAFKHLKVADIFMGGGTTLVEGSRLGMRMFGNDLNPVAWFVVKQELANVDLDEVKRLLSDIEAEVKPMIMPYYFCDGPNGERGKWTHLPSGKVMGLEFDPLAIPADKRKEYRYEGPEIIYTFWAKHGPCQVTGCGHRTPIMTSPVMAVKTITVKYWEHKCDQCHQPYHVEEKAVRMAPDVPLYVAPGENPFSVRDPKGFFTCPFCNHTENIGFDKGKSKKVELTLLVHPKWLEGSPGVDPSGQPYGGSAQDDAESTSRWDQERASKVRLLEVRGILPETVTCPETHVTFRTGKEGGTVPKQSKYACGACGTVQDVLTTIKASGKTGPMAAYAIQGFAPAAKTTGATYNGRFFAPVELKFARQYDAALAEWNSRKDADLADYWPRSEVPYGFMTGIANGDIRKGHGFTHWWTMFNPRQLLVQTQLLKAITTVGHYSWQAREYVFGAFQQYLRNQNMFCFWDISRDCMVPHMSNNNFHPKSAPVENCVFPSLGRGNWTSCIEVLLEGREWASNPWEAVSLEALKQRNASLEGLFSGKSAKAFSLDPIGEVVIHQGSSTDLTEYETGTFDLVITDPPFGGLLHYSELSDFFYVWLRLVLKDHYPVVFAPEFTPKAMEAVSNRAREPEDSDGFYQRLLTQCWRETHRILKPGGLLAFTFHHSEDDPWVAVLESLFDAGFYLEATYPIRSDETKGEGEFGSKTIEYDIIHVCRKRTEEPKPVSWPRMRREVLADVRQLQSLLTNHASGGLPSADLQVIRRGKALEYFSRHYGKVFKSDNEIILVKEALVGINQILDEDANHVQDPPPIIAEPITRQFLRIFDGKTEVPRDQMQKFLRGSGIAPDEFEQRGWCTERNKLFTMVEPLGFAREWSGQHRNRLTSDLDQALVLVGACFENSGINALDILRNVNFKPHPAMKSLIEWLSSHGGAQETRFAALRAQSIYNNWASSNPRMIQKSLIFKEWEE